MSDADDMGAPLQCNQRLCGIFSYSPQPEADPANPGVYTRLEAYLDWIRENSIPREPTEPPPGPGGADTQAPLASLAVLLAILAVVIN